MANRSRVVKYRKPKNINIGMIIFGIILIYIIINLIMFFSRDKISVYEVVEGKSDSNIGSNFTGLILRDESILYAPKTGYVHFFVRDGSHVSVGNNLFTIDESGKLADLMEDNSENTNKLSDESIKTIKNEVYQFTSNFTSKDFSTVYDLKNNVSTIILDNYSESVAGLSVDANSYDIIKSDHTATISTYVDGYESLNENTVKVDDFNTGNYKKDAIRPYDLVEKDSPILKYINSEKWNILINLKDEELEKYKDKDVVELTFQKDNITTRGNFSIISNSNGNFGKITLNKYNVRYLYDRLVNIKINHKEISGLKIPKTSVVEKEFYSIPTSYASKGGNNSEDGFYKEVYADDGEVSIKFETPLIFYKSEDYYLVETTTFKDGDVIVMNDSSSRYQIGETKTLKGAYNINNGYTDFKQIDILAETTGYYIIAKNSRFGLTTYDYIVVDANLVKEDQVVYQ